MIIKKNVFTELLNCSYVPPEIGGVLGSKGNIITHFEFDMNNSIIKKAQYYPDIEYLNKILCNWNYENIKFMGMFHSHPDDVKLLSNADKKYITQIMQTVTIGYCCYFPIILPKKTIVPYKAYRTDNQVIIKPDKLIIKY